MMSAENFSLSNTLPNTTPGNAQPPKARAAEVLAEKKPESAASQSSSKKESKQDAALPVNADEAKLQMNKGLLQAMFGKPETRDSNAMRIFYQEVVTQLEGILKQELGDENFSLQKLADKTSGIEGQEDYWSPENTADRIVAGATGYFETFKKQHPNLSHEEQVEKFISIIAPAIDKGIDEAVSILKGFDVFDGEIKDNALKTQALVHDKLEAFRERMLGLNKEPDDKPLITE